MDNIKDLIDDEFNKIELDDDNDNEDKLEQMIIENNNKIKSLNTDEKVDFVLDMLKKQYPDIEISNINDEKLENMINNILK